MQLSWGPLASGDCDQGVGWGCRHLKANVAIGRPQVLPGCWPETSVLCHVGLFLGRLTTQQLGFPQSKCVREGIQDRAKPFSFCNRI